MLRFLLLFITSTFLNASEYQIFKDFYMGDTKEQVTKKIHAYDCTEEVGFDALCHDNYAFAGMDFLAVFLYNEQGLLAIRLITDYSQEKYLSMMNMVKDKFALVAMLDEQQNMFDMVPLYKQKGGIKASMQEITNFELKAKQGMLTYSMIDAETFNAQIRKCDSFSNLALSGGLNLRELDFILQGEYLILNFSCPNAYKAQLAKVQKAEDF